MVRIGFVCHLNSLVDDPKTVPPAIVQKFERIAYRVCNDARLDYDELASRAYELVTWLQEKWREGIKKNLTDDRAEEAAISSFGDLAEAAKSLRRPLHLRLWAFERYRPHRYLVFLTAYFLFSWVMVSDSHYELINDARAAVLFTDSSIIRDTVLSDALHMLFPFRLREWIVEGFGSFFVGFAAALSVMLIRCQFNVRNAHVNQMLLLRSAFSVIVLYAIVVLTVMPSYFTFEEIQYAKALLIRLPRQPIRLDVKFIIFCLYHVAQILLGWAGALCITSELCDVSRLSSHRRAKHEILGLTGTSYVSRRVICCWGLIVVAAVAIGVYHECFPLTRFSRDISCADRIVAQELLRPGVTITGSDVLKVVKEVSSGSRDMVTYTSPFLVRFKIDFFNGTNSVGVIFSDHESFFVNYRQYRFKSHILDPLVFYPARQKFEEFESRERN